MRTRSDIGQVSLVGIAIALVIVALLTGLSVGILVNGGSTGGSGGSGATGPVGATDDASAKSTLSDAQTAAAQAAVAGGYGALSATALSSAEPGVTFTSGPSTSTSTVSVANVAGTTGTGGDGGLSGLGGSGALGGGGSVELAVYSPSNTCWYVWLGTGGPLYGAQTGQRSCQAQAQPTAPIVAPESSGVPGWSAGSYPAV